MEQLVANYSDFSIQLTGNLFNLKAAVDEFTKLAPWNYSISEIYHEEFTHEPLTWSISGSGRWSIETENVVELASKYLLSGTITDAETGSNFFIQIELENGEVTYSCNTEYVSDEHYAYNDDNIWWYEECSYAIDEPEKYPEVIEFLLKHQIITQEELDEQSRSN